jgi:hypothetical protein
MSLIKKRLRMDKELKTVPGYGVIPEGGGHRFMVYAESVDQITITLNNLEYFLRYDIPPVRVRVQYS